MTNTKLIDPDTLERFMSTFWGYGSFGASLWMVGMEEACGENDLPLRIETWHRRGERVLEDVAEYHNDIGSPELFGQNAKLQRTWSKLIKAYLAASGAATSYDETRRFQIATLGRSDPSLYQTCLIELMPLPSPSTKKWLIKNHTEIEPLQSRKAYSESVAPQRIRALKDRIDEFRPKAVVFYGSSYLRHWEAISGKPFEVLNDSKMRRCSSGGTEFFVMPHPVAHGVTNADFIAIGEILRENADWNDRETLVTA